MYNNRATHTHTHTPEASKLYLVYYFSFSFSSRSNILMCSTSALQQCHGSFQPPPHRNLNKRLLNHLFYSRRHHPNTMSPLLKPVIMFNVTCTLHSGGSGFSRWAHRGVDELLFRGNTCFCSLFFFFFAPPMFVLRKPSSEMMTPSLWNSEEEAGDVAKAGDDTDAVNQRGETKETNWGSSPHITCFPVVRHLERVGSFFFFF